MLVLIALDLRNVQSNLQKKKKPSKTHVSESISNCVDFFRPDMNTVNTMITCQHGNFAALLNCGQV